MGDETGESVEGTVRGMFSENDDCICCEGVHRFSTYIEVNTRLVDRSLRMDMNGQECSILDSSSWLHRILHRLPDGARVRLTVEPLGHSGRRPDDYPDAEGLAVLRENDAGNGRRPDDG